MKSKARSGLSLIEVLIAVLILATTVWAIQVGFVTLLQGGGKNTSRQMALAKAESLLHEWKERAREEPYWSDPAGQFSGIEGIYYYKVELGQAFDDPLNTSSGEELNFRLLHLTVFYSDPKSKRSTSSLSPAEPQSISLRASVNR